MTDQRWCFVFSGLGRVYEFFILGRFKAYEKKFAHYLLAAVFRLFLGPPSAKFRHSRRPSGLAFWVLILVLALSLARF